MAVDEYSKYQKEWEAFIDWLIPMVKFWSISALAYVTVFYQSTLAGWVLGSLVVLYGWDKYKEHRHDTDNGHEAAE